MLVVTATPHRISFFGGGTDLPDFYRQAYGAVLSTTINQFVYVTVKNHGKLFNEPYRLNYSQTELVDTLDRIENDIAREIIRKLNVPAPIYISTVADMPSGSGLGSSSSFAVGLAQAFHAMAWKRPQAAELAELASDIEINVLKKPIGKQDQYNAAVGGMNYFRFNPNDSVAITSVRVSRERIETLFDSFLLLWTGITRDAESVLKNQKKNIDNRMSELTAMRDMADEGLSLLESPNFSIEAFGKLLDQAWRTKRKLTKLISSSMIDEAYEQAMKAGAYGGKICGAGAGGFLLLCVPPEKKRAVREALAKFKELNIDYEPHGARVLFPHTHVTSATGSIVSAIAATN